MRIQRIRYGRTTLFDSRHLRCIYWENGEPSCIKGLGGMAAYKLIKESKWRQRHNDAFAILKGQSNAKTKYHQYY